MLDLPEIPEPRVARTAAVAAGVADSIAYLASDAALRSLAIDAYWPKWHSPWWHMLLLHELGETHRIPGRVVTAMAAALDGLLHIFPVRPDEAPGANPQRDLACHCALGTMVPLLAACGVDIDRALPWVEPWFVRYQMADGGLNCDETAYAVTTECPSSMVATVPALEAMLGRPASPAQRAFVDRAAHFLIERALVRGSPTVHNADERTHAPAWTELAFPRFYFYDVLRGLTALSRWAELTAQPLPAAAIAPVVASLSARFPDGVVRIGRQAQTRHTSTVLPTADRSPSPRGPTTSFPLLDAVSVIGAPSEALTRAWSATRARLRALAV